MPAKQRHQPPTEQLAIDFLDVPSVGERPTMPEEAVLINPTLIQIRKMEQVIEVLNGLDEEARLRDEIHTARSQAGRVGDVNLQRAFKDQTRSLEDKLDKSMEDTKGLFASMIGVAFERDDEGKVLPQTQEDIYKLDVRYTEFRNQHAGRESRIVGFGSQKERVDPREYREKMRKVYRKTIKRQWETLEKETSSV